MAKTTYKDWEAEEKILPSCTSVSNFSFELANEQMNKAICAVSHLVEFGKKSPKNIERPK